MRFALPFSLFVGVALSTLAEVPEIDSFRDAPQYPAPAVGADLTLGAADGDGRLVFWDGDTVYHQERDEDTNDLTGRMIPSGAGYIGNPSFVAIRDNDRTVLLGSGVDGVLYLIRDIGDGLDFVPGEEIAIPTHYSGALLSNRYLLLDRVTVTGSEIVLVDLDTEPVTAALVLSKPAGSAPAAITVSPSGRVYVMNATTRELRHFDDAAITDAYETMTTLDWSTDGIPVGTIGQFLNGGVYGVTPDNELVLGGDENAAGTGGIQWVDPNTTPATILATLDPAGSGPPYVLIYSRHLDRVAAIDPTVNPPILWAATDFLQVIPPDSPCDDFDAITEEFTAFIKQYTPESTDLDADLVADSAMLALIGIYACQQNDEVPLAFATNTAYDNNREVFATEASAGALETYERIIPILLFMNSSMQSAVLGLLSDAGTGLSGSYTTVTCSDIENCLPEFVEDPDARRAGRGVYEPYHGNGDADGDEVLNVDEYNNVLDIGGDDMDFAIAAASDEVDGSGGIDTGSSGGCFIATAAYGTPMAAQLDGLRAFRDDALLDSSFGIAFADVYYRLSPPAAAWLAQRPAMRALVRTALLPLVNHTAGIALALAVIGAGLALAGVRRANAGVVQRK